MRGMLRILLYDSLINLFLLFGICGLSQTALPRPEFFADSILKKMVLVNDHFKANQWKQVDRNWKRGTYFTGLMVFYKESGDSSLLRQAIDWGTKHGWRTGSEWIYPANRLTCSQTWLELYLMDKNEYHIQRTKSFMDNRVNSPESAFESGWDYIDALFVGTPAWVMMSEATGDTCYKTYGVRSFKEVADSLYDMHWHLFYRDLKAKYKHGDSGLPEFWSRGNGWAFAAIPRILDHLPGDDSARAYFQNILMEMAESLADKQMPGGYWCSSLANNSTYPGPESSGTAFFTYGLAWGIDHKILDRDKYMPVVQKAWQWLYHDVDINGKVCYGQQVARAPGHVDKEDSAEYVAGAFLLAGAEILRLIKTEQ